MKKRNKLMGSIKFEEPVQKLIKYQLNYEYNQRDATI